MHGELEMRCVVRQDREETAMAILRLGDVVYQTWSVREV